MQFEQDELDKILFEEWKEGINAPKPQGQTKKMSFAESLLNVAIGYGIAIAAQMAVFPLFGIHIPLHDNLMIGGIFTVISIVRSYFLRRFFNFLHTNRG